MLCARAKSCLALSPACFLAHWRCSLPRSYYPQEFGRFTELTRCLEPFPSCGHVLHEELADRNRHMHCRIPTQRPGRPAEPDEKITGGSMGDGVSQVFVEIDADPGDDAEYLARLTYRLRDELLALDVDNVELAAAGEAPDGSMGVSVLATGGL